MSGLRRLIVNADDYGLTPGVSAGIRRAHAEGIVTSTTFMVNWPWAEEAARALRDTPGLGVGLHLTLDAGPPVLPPAAVPSLVGPDGWFRKGLRHLLCTARLDEVQREWEAQVRRFVDLMGRPPTHLDTHHFVQALPRLAPVFVQVARAAGIPRVRALRGAFRPAARAWLGRWGEWLAAWAVRRSDGMVAAAGLRSPDRILVGQFDRERLLAWIRSLPEGVTELVCHPGYVDDHLLRLSSLRGRRADELAILCDPAVGQALREAGVELIHYGQL